MLLQVVVELGILLILGVCIRCHIIVGLTILSSHDGGLGFQVTVSTTSGVCVWLILTQRDVLVVIALCGDCLIGPRVLIGWQKIIHKFLMLVLSHRRS